MNRIFTLLAADEEVSQGKVDIDVDDIKGSVTFEHVQFGYDDEAFNA